MKKNSDIYLFAVLTITSFVSVYFFPSFINKLIFLIILFGAYQTKMDYVFLIWFFLINDAPGRLFSAASIATEQRIPLYTFSPGISVSFQEIFIIVFLIKYFQREKQESFIFKKEFHLFFFFGLFIVVYSILVGMSNASFISTIRVFMPWLLILIVPTYLYSVEVVRRASLLIFPFVFFAFISQIYSYISGTYYDHYLRGVEYSGLALTEDREISRSYSAVYLVFFILIQALYYLFEEKSKIKNNYLALIIFISCLTIYLSATRGWIIAGAFLLIGSLIMFFFNYQIKKPVQIVIIAAIGFLAIAYQFPLVPKQIESSYERIRTIEALLEGDITAGGSMQRLHVRVPIVMEKYYQSPILGWGFSDEYFQYADGHIGHHNILLNVGIIGYILLNGLFIHILTKIWRSIRTSYHYKEKAPNIYLLGMIAVFIIHSTSVQFWGYPLSMEKIVFFGFFFAALNAILLSRKHSVPENAL